MAKNIDPAICAALEKVLVHSTGIGIDCYEAMEVFTRALISVALDAADGDNAKAAEWIDKWLLPNIYGFRNQLANGGRTAPICINGKMVN